MFRRALHVLQWLPTAAQLPTVLARRLCIDGVGTHINLGNQCLRFVAALFCGLRRFVFGACHYRRLHCGQQALIQKKCFNRAPSPHRQSPVRCQSIGHKLESRFNHWRWCRWPLHVVMAWKYLRLGSSYGSSYGLEGVMAWVIARPVCSR